MLLRAVATPSVAAEDAIGVEVQQGGATAATAAAAAAAATATAATAAAIEAAAEAAEDARAAAVAHRLPLRTRREYADKAAFDAAVAARGAFLWRAPPDAKGRPRSVASSLRAEAELVAVVPARRAAKKGPAGRACAAGLADCLCGGADPFQRRRPHLAHGAVTPAAAADRRSPSAAAAASAATAAPSAARARCRRLDLGDEADLDESSDDGATAHKVARVGA